MPVVKEKGEIYMSKHITYEQTKIIENMLDSNSSLETIALTINKDPRGVSRHIKKYREIKINNRYKNICANQENCTVKHLCDACANGKCTFCSYRNCNDICKDFTTTPNCKKLNRFPFVCNGCNKCEKCKLPKYFYFHSSVEKEMKRNLVDSRSHRYIPNEQIEIIDSIVSPLILKGQSPEIIILTHSELHISVPTLYSLIHENRLSVKDIDLLRKVKYKSRKKKKKTVIEYNYLKDRYYEDFINYISIHSNLHIWELDTIEGEKGGKAILSLLSRSMNLQLFFLIDNIDTNSIVEVFDYLKDELSESIFKATFQVILTDRGKEFKDPISIEFNEIGEILCKVFYCDSRQSQQKGKCEKNHVEFRIHAPKGTSFNNWTQEKVNFISNHVNNYGRPKFNGNSPYDIAKFYFNEKILKLNNVTKLQPEDVIHKQG